MKLCNILFRAGFLSICLTPELLHTAPHNALQWADSWCWMNASLQCLASIDPLYNALTHSQRIIFENYLKSNVTNMTEEQKDAEQTLEYRLWKVLGQIRHETVGKPVPPSGLSKKLELEVSKKMHSKLEKHTDFDYFKKDSPLFVTKLFDSLFSSGKPLEKLSPQFLNERKDFSGYVVILSVPPNDTKFNAFKLLLEEKETKLADFVTFSAIGNPSFSQLAPPSFKTNKTIDEKERTYELFAAVLGNGLHAVAVVKDDDPTSNKWYFYNDFPPEVSEMNSEAFLTTYTHNGYWARLLFFRAENPVQKKLENLRQRLVTLRDQLHVLRDKLKTLQQKIQSKG